MNRRESVRHCEVCEELTPHSERVVAWPKVLATGCFGVATALFFVPAARVLGVFPLAVGFALIAFDRRRRWGIECERCRGKRVWKERSERHLRGPTLDGNTEICPF